MWDDFGIVLGAMLESEIDGFVIICCEFGKPLDFRKIARRASERLVLKGKGWSLDLFGMILESFWEPFWGPKLMVLGFFLRMKQKYPGFRKIARGAGERLGFKRQGVEPGWIWNDFGVVFGTIWGSQIDGLGLFFFDNLETHYILSTPRTSQDWHHIGSLSNR